MESVCELVWQTIEGVLTIGIHAEELFSEIKKRKVATLSVKNTTDGRGRFFANNIRVEEVLETRV